jgi:hypothetical protein
MATVLYRDYRAFEGLQMPVTIETGVVMGKAMNKLVIEKVSLNPELDEKLFAKPAVPVSRRAGAAVIDTRGAATTTPSGPARQP